MSVSLIKRLGITILLLFTSLSFPATAQDIPTAEYRVKAGFLFNFTKFIEWPPAAFKSHEAPLVIGIIGKDPFGNYIDQVVSGERINGHPIAVERYESVKEIKGCHILYITTRDPEKVASILEVLKSDGVLTISDTQNFLPSGGMVRFVLSNNKIRLHINPTAAKSAGLNISSALLRVAEIYNTPNH